MGFVFGGGTTLEMTLATALGAAGVQIIAAAPLNKINPTNTTAMIEMSEERFIVYGLRNSSCLDYIAGIFLRST
jgi:hypothetical protein